MPDLNTKIDRFRYALAGRGFSGNSKGNVAIIFALALVPLVIAAGAALDYSSASHKRGQLQTAADAAALAGSATSPWTEEACRERAKQVYRSSVADKSIPGADEARIVCDANGVSVAADARVPTSLLNAVGIRHVDLHATSDVTCGMRSEAGSSQPIAWRQTHLPDMTRVVTLGTTVFGTVFYWRTPEGNPIVRIDNPSNEPTTIVLRSTPASPNGNFSFHLPDRGQYFVVIPYVPPGQLVFRIHEGPEPRSSGTATWDNTNNRTITTIPGTPVYAAEEVRRCWISS